MEELNISQWAKVIDVHVTPTIFMTCNDDARDVRRHNRNIMFTKYWNSNHLSWPTNMINKIKIGGGSMTNLTLICFDHNSIFIQSLLNVHLFASFMCVNWWKHYKKLRIVHVSIGFGDMEESWSCMCIL